MTCLESEKIHRIVLDYGVEAQKQLVENWQAAKKKVIILAGPTGCGKTALSLYLAEAINGEVISADSMQVYKGMDLGTAKATMQERSRVPHHLIDIRDIRDPYNVVDFYYEARHACQRILERGAVPIIAGGSGFYVHSLLYGPPPGPPSVPDLRKALEVEMEERGADVLYEKLRQMDPEYAATITRHDKHKIVRGLEIIKLSNQKVSQLIWKGRTEPQHYNFRCWFLFRPREKLYHRIEKRCDQMMEEGFLAEVEALLEAGIKENSSAAQAIGYRQAIEYLEGDRSKQSYHSFLTNFKQASRHYAKRQLTWFRKEPLFRWLDLDVHDPEIAVEIIRKDFEAAL